MSLHDDDDDFPGLLENGIPWEIILCNAARYASAEVVSYLIKEVGLDVRNATFFGKKAIHYALENPDSRVLRDILTLLLSQCPDIDKETEDVQSPTEETDFKSPWTSAGN